MHTVSTCCKQYKHEECTARYETMAEHHAEVMVIEAKALLEMVRRRVQPAVIAYAGKVADACNAMATYTDLLHRI